jgi:polyketide synthase 7
MTSLHLGRGEADATRWCFSTLADALAQQAKDRADSVAVRFIEPGGASLADSAIATLTFAELEERASRVAGVLAESAQPGERALLLCPPGLDYVAALFGCFRAGVIAVPAYPPTSADVDERLTRLIGDSSPSVVLTTTALAEVCEPLCPRATRSDAAPRAVRLDALEPADRFMAAAAPARGDLALLQYTSGSTGDPSGVMLTHGNLLANVASIASHLELADDARGVFWLPPYHDMGLVGGILASVVLGGETTLLSPLSFLANPLLWLEAVSRYRGTFSAAPNFAYDLCVRKVSREQAAALDLSSWKSVVNGAEPVRAETMDRFAAHFAAAGFRRSAFMPAYGLAEATLLVSAARLGPHDGPRPALAPSSNGAGRDRAPAARALVSVGRPDDHARLLIVDPETRRPLPEGEVGEIWFSGPTVGVGYWGNQEKSEATFAATLAEEPDGARFLRTGDLGELRRGELHVGGRIKDLIIVRGQNYHPHDIELAATRADQALRPGCLAAFALDDDEGQRLVLVAELAGEPQGDDAGRALFERVRARVGRDVGLALDELVLIERGASLKTSSGKIRRAATRAAYLEEGLRPLARYRSACVASAPSVASGGPAASGGDAREILAAAGVAAGEPSSNGASAQRALRLRALAEHPPHEREERLRALVLGELALLRADVSPEAIAAGRSFNELGLESLDVVELSVRLSACTGLDLSPTVCFEHASPAALVAHLCSRLGTHTRQPLAPARPRAVSEPVAIVGMGCRFPGGVDSPESLWALLRRGADAISEFPDDRGWDLERLFDTDRERPGTSHARAGGFLDDAGGFDARFFGISPRQAGAIDPQQRLILEVAWEALEDAGIDPTSLDGSATSVYAGVSSTDHALRLGAGQPRETEGQLLTGAAASAVSGRLAYVLGLTGAAVTVDTACSSSLVALHEACRALASDECSLALAGGVTVLSTPVVFTDFSRQGALAADGRCKAFSAAADGTGFSEGAGLLVLERLRDARERGHRVLALVRGSAINQDGRSNGFTAPNPGSQEAVIRAALAAARLAPRDVDAVEAHGTGTVLGDPIEARALIAAYGQGRTRPLWLGSVKSNLGHTQAAAGVAGVIKMVMAMRHGLLPETLHADEPSQHVDWAAGPLRLLLSAQEWPRGGRPRRAGISSFGISGTNAHVILEEPEAPAEPSRGEGTSALPWVLSARSEPALREQAGRLRAQLERDPGLSAADVAYTLATGRARMECRAAIVGRDRAALVRGLDALVSGEHRGRARTDAKAAFIFAGQGAQWDGMARELMGSSAVFAHRVRACGEALAPHVDWSLEEVLQGLPGAPALDRVDVIQPALWAVMVSLAELWRSFGVEPALVAGHSQGEIAAAQVAGGLSLEDAARIVALRGQALRAIEGAGGMVSLPLGADAAERLMARLGTGRVWLAATNSPSATVVSGEADALAALLASCEAEGIAARRIAVGFASHSPHVEAIRERFVRSLASLRPRSGRVPFHSCLAGRAIDTAGLDGEYWYRNLREPVRFVEATRALLREGCSALIEMSPHPVLAVPMQETIDEEAAGESVAVISSLRRGGADSESFVRALGEAFVHGLEVDWKPLFAAQRARLVALPTYPFERERHWPMPQSREGERAARGDGDAEHPLLERSMWLADRDAWVSSGRVALGTHPWLAEQRVLDAVLLPASGFLEIALHAGREVGCEEVHELTLELPLVLPDDGAIELQASVSEPGEDGRRALLIASRPLPQAGGEASEWQHHARGTLAPAARMAPAASTAETWPPAGAQPIGVDHLRERLAELGVAHGRTFEPVRAAWRLGDEVFAELVPADADADRGPLFDPALVDSILQTASVRSGAPAAGGALMPCAFRGARAERAGASPLRARVAREGDSLALVLGDADGRSLLSVGGIEMRPLDAGLLRRGGEREREMLLGLRWVGVSTPARASAQRCLGVIGDVEADALGAPRYAGVDAAAAAVSADDQLRALIVGVSTEDQSPGGVRDAAHRTLALLRSWLADERLASVRLVLVTRGAVAVRGEESPSLAGAAVWGLVRSAQSEQRGRFTLADLDGSSASWEALRGALALEEPQLALRGGELLVPRLAPQKARAGAGRPALDPAGTVLITGGTGGLGRLIAGHLARAHGVRHLLLASRRGPAADGAAELEAELAELGCRARVVACDVADRRALERMLAEIPPSEPLTAVIHAAGVMDDGLLESLDRERLDRVMAPKVDAAMALDELTAAHELAAFVLISSAVATLGGPGQANYAAANSVLDAIAQARRARGLPAQSLAFGLWQVDSGLWQRGLGEEGADRADALAHLESQIRTRMGMLALEPERGLALFDGSLAAGEAFLAPIRMDMEILRANAQVDAISPVLRGLVRPPRRRDDLGRSLRQRLVAASADEREAVVLALVSEEAAAVLGCGLAEIAPERTLVQLGGESLNAIEVRNRLEARSGVRLATRLFFEQPLRAVAGCLREAIDEGLAPEAHPAHERPSTPSILRNLLESAREAGRVDQLIATLIRASRLRATFDSVSEVPQRVPLTVADRQPRLICIPSFMAGSGPHQFGRLANGFEQRRSVAALHLPGWRIEDRAPATLRVAIEALWAAVRAAVGEEPYVLVGYSSGGAFAHALAERGEAEGGGPAAVVMIDTYTAGDGRAVAAVLGEITARAREHEEIDDGDLLAMGTYLRLASEWTPGVVRAPALYLRAAVALAAVPDPQPLRAPFAEPPTVISLAADHFTIIEDHAHATASAIDAWIRDTAESDHRQRASVPPRRLASRTPQSPPNMTTR